MRREEGVLGLGDGAVRQEGSVLVRGARVGLAEARVVVRHEAEVEGSRSDRLYCFLVCDCAKSGTSRPWRCQGAADTSHRPEKVCQNGGR